jgi:hypothetical protein
MALFGIAQRCLDVLVAEALADCCQAYTILDEGRRVAMAELMQTTLDAYLGTVGSPVRLDYLVVHG